MKKFNLIVKEICDDVDDAELSFETFCGAIEDNTMSVNLMCGKTLEMCLSDKEEFIKCMTQDLEIQYGLCVSEGDFYHYNKNKLFWDYFNENFDNIYDAVDYFIIEVEGDEIEFLKNHPKLQDKKIVFPYYINISDFEKVELLLNDYKDYPNIFVYMQGNYGFVNLRDCYKIMNEIQTKSEHIKSLNLSPAESVMYAYDLVRDRVYKREKDDNENFSRDLKDILFNDAIVCIGFARILACILDNLGINNELVYLNKDDCEVGHARNAVYLDDDKYDIHGYYHLDPTWDSKKTNQNDNYLYRYLYFLKTEQEIYELGDCKFSRNGQVANLNNLYVVLENLMNSDDDSLNIISEISQIIVYINFLYRLVYRVSGRIIDYRFGLKDGKNKVILKNCVVEDIKDIIADIDVKLNKSISAETFIELANNVRKIEHYINPEKFPYSMNVLYNIYLKSGWKFKDKHYNPQELLLARIMGEPDESAYDPENDFINFINFDAKITQDPSRIQLTRTLKKVLDKKNEQN